MLSKLTQIPFNGTNFVKIQYVCTERQTNVIINIIGYVHFACSEEVSCINVNRFVSVNCSVQRKRSNGELVFLFS